MHPSVIDIASLRSSFSLVNRFLSILNISLTSTPSYSLIENVSLSKKFQKNCTYELIFKTFPNSLLSISFWERCSIELSLYIWKDIPYKYVSNHEIHPQGNRSFIHLQWIITLFNVFKNNFCFSWYLNNLIWKRSFCKTEFKGYRLLRDFP